MELIEPNWRSSLQKLVSSAEERLWVVSPYYGRSTIEEILLHCSPKVKMLFLLKLTEAEVRQGSQSPTVLQFLAQDKRADVRLGKNIHAKVIIADEKAAIVTSSNLTSPGLDRNVEYGVRITERRLLRKLLRSLNYYWKRAEPLDPNDLPILTKLEGRSKMKSPQGKSYGNTLRLKKGKKFAQRHRPQQRKLPSQGWILVHSPTYFETDQNLQEELRETALFGNRTWRWNLRYPLSKGGPYAVLFALKGWVFGDCVATIIHDIDTDGGKWNFGFVMSNYRELRDHVPLEHIVHDSRAVHHHSLIVLDKAILERYERWARVHSA